MQNPVYLLSNRNALRESTATNKMNYVETSQLDTMKALATSRCATYRSPIISRYVVEVNVAIESSRASFTRLVYGMQKLWKRCDGRYMRIEPHIPAGIDEMTRQRCGELIMSLLTACGFTCSIRDIDDGKQIIMIETFSIVCDRMSADGYLRWLDMFCEMLLDGDRIIVSGYPSYFLLGLARRISETAMSASANPMYGVRAWFSVKDRMESDAEHDDIDTEDVLMPHLISSHDIARQMRWDGISVPGMWKRLLSDNKRRVVVVGTSQVNLAAVIYSMISYEQRMSSPISEMLYDNRYERLIERLMCSDKAPSCADIIDMMCDEFGIPQ